MPEAEDFYQHIVENSRDGIVIVQEGLVVYSNPRALEYGGFRLEDVVGHRFTEFFHPDDIPVVLERYQQRMQGQPVEQFYELRLRRNDGGFFPVEISGARISFKGQPADLVTFRDISIRREAEERIRFYQKIFANSEDPIAILNPDWTYREQNPAHELQFGYSYRDLAGRTPELLLGQPLLTRLEEPLRESGSFVEECRVSTRDGRVVDVELSIYSIMGDAGGIDCHVMAYRDISARKKMEQALRESEEKFRNLADEITDGVLVAIGGKIYWVNQAMVDLGGYTREEFSGAGPEIMVDREHLGEIYRNQQARIQGDRSLFYYELPVRRKDGKRLYVQAVTKAVEFDGHPASQMVIRDITARKLQEQRLKESEEGYRNLFEHSPLGICRTLADGSLVECNPALVKMLGYGSREAFLASVKQVHDLAEDRNHGGFDCVGDCRTNPETTCFGETRLTTRDGGVITVILSSRTVFAPDGDIQFREHYIENITERKQYEDALRRGEEKFRTLAQEITDGIVIGVEGKVYWANRAFLDLSGYSMEELRGAGPDFMVEPSLLEDMRIKFESRRDGDRSLYHYEMVARRKDGRILILDAMTKGVEFDGHEATQLVVRDITSRKEQETRLRESEERYRNLFEHSPIGICRTLDDGVLLDCNSSLVRMLEYSSREGFLTTVSQFNDLVEESCLGTLEGLRTYRDNPETVCFGETRLRTASGGYITVILTSRNVLDSDGRIHYREHYIENITDRKQYEDALRRSEEKFRVLAETSPIAIYIHQGGKFLYCNPATETITGYSREELLTKEFWEVIHPDERDLVKNRGINRLKGILPPNRYVVKLLTKSGNERWVDLMSEVLEVAGERFVMGTAMDITDRHLAEEQLRESLSEKKVLLKEIHHRVKNNLQIISSLLHLQSRRLTDRDTLEKFTECQARIQSMALIHTKLYQSETFSRINFPDYVQSLTSYLLQLFGRQADRISLKEEIEDISLDLDRAIPCGLILNEAFSNALKHAFPDHRSGEILIRLESAPQNRVRLTIRDNGVGLPESYDLSHTESLGLTLIDSLVDQLDGQLEIERAGGTTFVITFPVPSA